MSDLWSATLVSASPRYRIWKNILGGDDVPLRSPAPKDAILGEERAQIYQLAIERLSVEQKNRLVQWIATTFDAPESGVRAEIALVGFPIRAVDVSIAYSVRALL